MGKSTIQLKFYVTSSGNQVVYDFINALPQATKKKTFRLLDFLRESPWFLKEPYVKRINSSLYELRVVSKLQVRLLYAFLDENKIIVLHGFIKKSKKIPTREIKTALDRLKEFI